jgi:lipopolysaccharide export system protein LptC
VSVELHLPDLPEVPISLGRDSGGPPRPAAGWHLRLRDALSSYLPLLLMMVLALATWWLVKNTPSAPAPREAAALRHDPDYAMTAFALERFAADGRLKLRIEGATLRHFPDTDRVEIERPQIRAIAPDGRVTLASAQRAIGNGDGSEMQLVGGAEVTSADNDGTPIVIRSEFLHAFLLTERVHTHLPVRVQRGTTELSAGGLEYDHGGRRLDLQGPMRAEFPPAPRR